MDESREKGVYVLPEGIPIQNQENLGAKGHFYVGGDYAQDEQGTRFLYGQMYVEVYVPKKILHPYPIILIHGAGLTGYVWMRTPDKRRGWTDLLIDKGYVVYVVDVPTRGRSVYHPSVDGELKRMEINTIEHFCTGTNGDWPSAHLHTQSPPVDLEEMVRPLVTWTGYERTQELVQKAAAELLDLVGPSILVTHSMSGTFGWPIADIRPQLVRGIIALEPTGPQFAEVLSFGRAAKAREYGLTDIPMTYVPELKRPAWRDAEPFEIPDVNDVDAWLQPEPAGQLVNLVDIPVALVTGEASYHTMYDHLTVAFLKQAGLRKLEHIELGKHGIHGNGHMMIEECNNDQILNLISDWIVTHIESNNGGTD